MIKTTAMLKNELVEYVNPTAKIRQLVNKGELFTIIRGLYETDGSTPGYLLAPIIYGPSYLSFEFALAYYSLIPEAVYTFTCASFEKKKTKTYETSFGTFTYRDIPSSAYSYGVILKSENGYGFQIASPEKAICDQLYKISPLSNRKELEEFLLNDLRVYENDFYNLDFIEIFEIAGHYNTQNHKLLQAYVRRRLQSGKNN